MKKNKTNEKTKIFILKITHTQNTTTKHTKKKKKKIIRTTHIINQLPALMLQPLHIFVN